MNVSEQVLSRIEKLLNMTTANGCSEAEAANAAAKAHALLDKHNLAMADIRSRSEKPADPAEGLIYSTVAPGKMTAYLSLLTVVCRTCYCRAMKVSGKGQRRCYLIGDPVNIKAATMLYEFLREQIDGLRKEARKGVHVENGYVPRAFTLDWTNGICDRLIQRLKEDFAERTREAAGSAIVVYNEQAISTFILRHFRVKHNRHTRKEYGSRFYSQGYEAGNRANIRHAEAVGR